MKAEYLDFFKVLSRCLHGEKTTDLDVDWNYIFQEAKDQAIVPLLVGNVGITPWGDNKKEAMSIFMGNMKLYQDILKEQDRLDKILSDKGIKYAVLKGTAAAQYYPHPEYRTYGDIDIIIERDRFEEARAIFISEGYKLIEDFDESGRHVEIMSPSGIEIEAHIRFSFGDNEIQKNNLDRIISDSLSNIEDNKTSILPDSANGITLIEHINQHLYSGLGMRQIIDWMYYVESVVTDDFWNSGFNELLNFLGLQKLACITTCVCKRYLGLKSDSVWYASFMDDGIVEELTDYILNNGNFGIKGDVSTKSSYTLRLFKNPIKGLKKAQLFGKRNWKMLGKYPGLKPFAWIYQLGRWTSHASKKGASLSSINSTNNLLERLK